MMIKKVAVGLKQMGSHALIVSGLFVFAMFANTTTSSAQALKQGVEAAKVMKTECSALVRNNCVKAVSTSVPVEIRNLMQEMRCDMYQAVYSGLMSGQGLQATASRVSSMTNQPTERIIEEVASSILTQDSNSNTVIAVERLKDELKIALRS